MNDKVNSTAHQRQYRKTNEFGDSSTFFLDFQYSSLGMLRWKINKNGAKIYSKTSVKSIPQLASILAPIWLHFGMVLGAKLVPNRSKSRSQKWSKKQSPFRWPLDGFLIDFRLQFGGQMGRWDRPSHSFLSSWDPRSLKTPQDPSQDRFSEPQDPPNTQFSPPIWGPNGSLRSTVALIFKLLGPKISQDPPRPLPRSIFRAPGPPQHPHFGAKLYQK